LRSNRLELPTSVAILESGITTNHQAPETTQLLRRFRAVFQARWKLATNTRGASMILYMMLLVALNPAAHGAVGFMLRLKNRR